MKGRVAVGLSPKVRKDSLQMEEDVSCLPQHQKANCSEVCGGHRLFELVREEKVNYMAFFLFRIFLVHLALLTQYSCIVR